MRLLTRRASLALGSGALGGLLARSAVAGPRSQETLSVPDWSQNLGTDVATQPYGTPSRFESEVIRRKPEGASPVIAASYTPLHALEGIITPNGLGFERHHAGAPNLDPAEHRLLVHGLVDRPLVFTLADLERFPKVNRCYFLECAGNTFSEWQKATMPNVQFTHGLIQTTVYTGVLLKDLLAASGIKAKASWILAEGADAAGLTRSLPMAKALDDCMVAFKMNGEALRPEHGYPMRLVVPGWEGNIWIKWLRRLKLGDEPWFTREETAKYTDLMPDGKARYYSWVMDAKSVITSPAPEMPGVPRGRNALSGIAWSGRGEIAAVDVSLDGGVNWLPARIDGQPAPFQPVRFYYEFDWQGRELLLQSRAVDSTGYVQPSRSALRTIRGTKAFYRNNGIQTWRVSSDGEVQNVQIS